jgi:hypothetical protein
MDVVGDFFDCEIILYLKPAPQSPLPATLGIALDGEVEKPQFQILEHAPLQQAVDVLEGAGTLNSIFDFANTTLHGFGSAGKRRAIGDCRYLVLLNVQADAWCLGAVRSFFLSW